MTRLGLTMDKGMLASGWRRLKSRLHTRLAIVRIRLAGERPFVLGLWVNGSEALAAAAVRPGMRFIRIDSRYLNRGWTHAEVAAFLLRLAHISEPDLVIVWGIRDRVAGHDLKKLFPNVVRIETGLLPGIPHRRLTTAFLINRIGIYFDGRSYTDWEGAVQELRPGYARSPAAQEAMARVRGRKLTKYRNWSETIVDLPPDALLVLGQVNGDQAVEYTRTIAKSNFDFIAWLHEARPVAGALCYKPHPMNRDDNEAEIARLQAAFPKLVVIDTDVNVHSLFEQRPRVATMTSGAGLEAALHGCEVHTFGISFYSNFGFTIDHFDCERRTNRLSAEDLASFMWLEWTVYVDPATRQQVLSATVLDRREGG